MAQIAHIHELKAGERYLVGGIATTYLGAGRIFTSSLEEKGALDLAVFQPLRDLEADTDYRDLIFLREPSFAMFQVTTAS
jgi:hypothetical protein